MIMTDEQEGIVFRLCLVAFLLGCIVGLGIGSCLEARAWRRAAVKHDFAEYGATTGRWQWKEASND